jgi:enamine deaminase RidA (YjgF/YER057c/UK114 family)
MAEQHIRSGSPYEAEYGFSRAVRVDNRVFVAGTAPIPPPHQEVADTAYDQMLRCGEIMLDAIGQAGGSPADVVRTRIYITDAADAAEIGRAHREIFGVAAPAATMVVVAGLLDAAWRVEAECECFPLKLRPRQLRQHRPFVALGLRDTTRSIETPGCGGSVRTNPEPHGPRSHPSSSGIRQRAVSRTAATVPHHARGG